MLSPPMFGAAGLSGKADPEDARRTNRLLIFGTLFPGRTLSRAQIARSTGLSRMAVSQVVQDMIAEGLLRETGTDSHDSSRGRKGTLLAVDDGTWAIVTIDLSSTRTARYALVDLQGRVLAHADSPMHTDPDETLRSALRTCRALQFGTDRPILGVGVAVTGLLTDERLVYAASLGWKNVDLRGRLGQELRVPVRIVHDVACALIAERFYGDHQPSMVLVRISSGVGAATLIDDRVVRGVDQHAGELGHVTVDPEGALCVCGRHGCLETLISQEALRARVAAAGPSRGDAVLSEAGDTLGGTLATVRNMLDIDDVVVAGPDDLVTQPFLDGVQRRLDEDTVVEGGDRCRVHRSRCGDDAVVRGAAVAIINDAVAYGVPDR